MNIVDIKKVKEARERLKGIIIYNKLDFDIYLSKISGAKVFLKKENLQLTGAFKIRGAFNKLASLKQKDVDNKTNILNRGVICSSAGNHAQGVAFSARYFGVRAVIVMPESTPFLKISRTRDMGAEVVLAGNNYDEAYSKALKIAKEQNLNFIHPFADEDVIAGQGSIALEMIEEESLDIVVVPIGGGGLISGIASAYKFMHPKTKIIGVQSKGANAMMKSFKQKKIHNSKSVRTIADGIAVRDVNKDVFECILNVVDDIVEVDDEEIASAILFLLEYQKLLVEGAGAAGVAAIMHNKIHINKNAKVGAVLSGGNIDVTTLNMIIEKGLFKSHRKMKIEVVLTDKPGSMQGLSYTLANAGANIVQISYDRTPTLKYGDVLIAMSLEIKGLEHKKIVLDSLKKSNYEFKEIF